MIRRTTEAAGLALLEVSIGAVVLLPVFLSAFAVAQSLGLVLRVSEVIEFALRSDETVPLRLQSGEMGPGGIEPDRQGIDRSLGELVSRIEAGLRDDTPNLTAERYRIEATVGIIAIDPMSGGAVRGGIEFRERMAGSFIADASDLERTAPRAVITRFSETGRTGSGVALVARENPARGQGYIDHAAILNVRLFRDVDGELVRTLRRAVGLSGYVSASQIAIARMEITR